MQKIIVPIDFSEISYAGLGLAILIAERNGAQIEMVHVLNEKNVNFDAAERKAETIAKSKEKFEKIIKEYKTREKKKLEFDYILKEGDIADEVVGQSHASESSMIVMSTKGESNVKEKLMGSNASNIVNNSQDPVITIKDNEVPQDIQKIVLPIDHTLESRQKVPFTVYLAKLFYSEIHVITIDDSSFDDIERKLELYEKQVADFIQKHNITYFSSHKEEPDIAKAVLDYAKSIDADLISVMTEQEKRLKKLILGDYTTRFINESPYPVLLQAAKETTIVDEMFKTLGVDY